MWQFRQKKWQFRQAKLDKIWTNFDQKISDTGFRGTSA